MKPPADKLLAKGAYEIIKAEGFPGSYPAVVRFMRDLRGPRFRAGRGVSVPIETAPGEECQVDWSDCSNWTGRWGPRRGLGLRGQLNNVSTCTRARSTSPAGTGPR